MRNGYLKFDIAVLSCYLFTDGNADDKVIVFIKTEIWAVVKCAPYAVGVDAVVSDAYNLGIRPCAEPD